MGGDSYHPAFYMNAIDAQTGAERTGWPVLIQGAPVNDPTRSSTRLRSGNGPACCSGARCTRLSDRTPTTSPTTATWSASVPAPSRKRCGPTSTGLTDSEAHLARWQRSHVRRSQSDLLDPGNGISPAKGPGSAPPAELGESVVRLNVGASGVLAAHDFFSPADAPALDANNRYLGSGGPVGLPYGSATYPELLVQAGKDGHMYLLNRLSLGGREQGTNGTDDVVRTAGPFPGQWGHWRVRRHQARWHR